MFLVGGDLVPFAHTMFVYSSLEIFGCVGALSLYIAQELLGPDYGVSEIADLVASMVLALAPILPTQVFTGL